MEPFPFKEIAAEDLPIFNEVFKRNGALAFDLAGRSVQWVFHPELRYKPQLGLKVSCEDVDFSMNLSVPDAVVRRMLTDAFQGTAFRELPPEIRAAVVEATFEELLDGLEARSGYALKVEEMTASPEGEGRPGDLYFTIREGEEVLVRGRLDLDREGSLRRLGEMVARAPVAPSPVDGDIPVTARVAAGAARLFVEELESLGPGDLVLLDVYHPSVPNRFMLHLPPRYVYPVDINGSTAVVQEGDPVEATDEAREDAPERLEDLEIELQFEVGRKIFRLAELGELKPGVAFELETPVDKAVTIRANGRRIGSGELARVGERVAVRVLEVFRHGTDEPS